MRRARVWWLRLRAIVRRPAMECEMDAEMADHLASEAEELTSRGLAPQEAARRARETMGRLDAIREECRDARGVNWWEHGRQDARFAVRLLMKRKAFAAVAIATMALGIGSTSAVFSVVDTVLIRPLPYPEPERLIAVDGLGMQGPFDNVRRMSRVVEYAGDEGLKAFNLVTGEALIPERVKGRVVSANFFAVLGERPLMGRTFVEDEDRPGRSRVVVLSHRFWSERYSGRRDVLGRQIVLDQVPYDIVGVMPADFRFGSAEMEFWTPMMLDPRSVGAYWGKGGTDMIGRLRRGATPESARQELRAIVPGIRTMFPWRMPDSWGTGLVVSGLQEAQVAGTKVRSWTLLSVAAFVMLIAVVNVANLMMSQTMARAREMAMRRSLGATAGRLGRQLLTESLVLTGVGGALGFLLGYAQLAMLQRVLPADTPRLADVAMDGRVLFVTAVVVLTSGLLVGLWPAWHSSLVVARRGRKTDALLVMTEAAFATLLLVGAGLFLRSLWSMLQVNPGFRVDTLVTAEMSPGGSRAPAWSEVREKLMSYPGVRAVSATNVLPVTPEISAFAVSIEDHPRPATQPQYVVWETRMSPEHREVLGIRLLEGREFTDTDRRGAERVAMISRSTARRFWPGASAVGRRLKPVSDRDWMTIVGVMDDVKTFSMAGPPSWVDGEVYVPLAQRGPANAMLSVVAQVDSDPGAFEKALPGLVHELCAACAVSKVARMEQVVRRATAAPRSMAWLVGGFALLALGLAAAGIYGLVNYGVVRRTRELGVRMALGARRGRVAALVVSASFRSVALGSAAGVAVAWFLSPLISNLLFGVAPHDRFSFAAGPVVLLLFAALASVLPALRATRIDPAECLREG